VQTSPHHPNRHDDTVCNWYFSRGSLYPGLFDLGLSMRYETLSLGGNVIRFPVELRAKPSIDLLIDVAPDSREVELIAEAFGFEARTRRGGRRPIRRWRRGSRRWTCLSNDRSGGRR
jgi:hypothetical protein